MELRDDDGKPIVYKDSEGKERKITGKCKLRFIDSCRFMQSSLSSLVDNLAGTNVEGIECCKDASLEFDKNPPLRSLIDRPIPAKCTCLRCNQRIQRPLKVLTKSEFVKRVVSSRLQKSVESDQNSKCQNCVESHQNSKNKAGPGRNECEI